MDEVKSRLRWLIVGVAALTLVAFLGWGWVPARIPDQGCRFTENGAWISVDWTSQPVNEDEVAQLVEDVSRRRIRYLYPFVTYLRADGTFSPSYEYAAEFVSAFREYDQGTYLLAWLGIPLVNEGQLGIQGTVDLSENATREAIVEMSLELVEGAGFDGVHLDVETVRSGDENYLLLLDEVREALGEQGIVSVAGSYWIPEVINQLPGIEGFKWDGEYYRAVAGRVDQIAVMTYDSVMPHPILYRLWLREQVRGIERSLDAANVELLFGLSVSREETFTHRPNAEDMQNGLAGICAGSAGGEAARGADGVAIYAAWEADTEDWAIWESWTSSLE